MEKAGSKGELSNISTLLSRHVRVTACSRLELVFSYLHRRKDLRFHIAVPSLGRSGRKLVLFSSVFMSKNMARVSPIDSSRKICPFNTNTVKPPEGHMRLCIRPVLSIPSEMPACNLHSNLSLRIPAREVRPLAWAIRSLSRETMRTRGRLFNIISHSYCQNDN